METFKFNDQFNQIQTGDGKTIVMSFGKSATPKHKKVLAASPELLDSCQEYKNLLEMIIGDENLWKIMKRNHAEIAAQASLQMDLERVSRRIAKTL